MVAVQWYPGHMEKTRRQMEESLKAVDCVIEVRDCRIPLASRNPLLEEMAARKPRLIVLTRLDLADPQKTALWLEALASDGTECLALDLSKDASAGKKVVSRCLSLCQPKIEKMKSRGIRPRAMRAMAAGIPNVGKSTLINRVAMRRTAEAANRPGVTRTLKWIPADPQLQLLDTPGVLWPKFEDPRVGSLLAVTGAISDEVLDRNMIAMDAIRILQQLYPGLLEKEYDAAAGTNPHQMLKAVAQKRMLLKEGGELDLRRAADVFLHELRRGSLGRLTLEDPQ
jgi:ribosome biogenesis GTPase A